MYFIAQSDINSSSIYLNNNKNNKQFEFVKIGPNLYILLKVQYLDVASYRKSIQ